MSQNYLSLVIKDQHGSVLFINSVVAVAGNLEICVDLPDRAAELPLERTGDTPKACFVSHKSIWDDDDNSYLFCPYCGERLSS